ncbi:MAG: hypothetical protein ACRD44_07610 [Bryobacteraceae bacterium]
MSSVVGLMIDNPVMRGAPESSRMDPARAKEVGVQFESLLIASMLKQMRESSGGGWLGGGEDQAGATAIEFAEEALAQSLAGRGGLGLAALIEKTLPREAENKTILVDKTHE